MSATPVVSIIVPCYNYGAYVRQCIDSVLAQTFTDLEVIAIDDASPDDTAAVLEPYREMTRARVVKHERNLGHLASYNEGISLARGRYLAILSADDYCLTTDAISRQVELFEANPGVGMVYTAHALVSERNGTSIVRPSAHDLVRDGLEEFGHLVWGNYIPHSGTLIRADVQADLGPYEQAYPHAGDWDLWLRTSLKYDVGYVASPCYAYRMHEASMRARTVTAAQAADESIEILSRAYATLDPVPSDLAAVRGAAMDHALLQNAWFDLGVRRRSRAWQAIAHAVRRRPRILRNPELWKLIAYSFIGRGPRMAGESL